MKTISCLTLKLLDSQWCNQNFFQDQDQYQDLTFKTKTKPSVRDLDQDFPSQDQDQDLFVMYTRGRLWGLLQSSWYRIEIMGDHSGEKCPLSKWNWILLPEWKPMISAA